MGSDLGLGRSLGAAESTEIGFSMADNNTSRFRSSDPFGRGPGSSGPANDPLAELARLIGQNDPFAEFGNRPQAQQPDQGSQASQGSYDNNDPTQPYSGQPAEPYAPEPAPAYSPEPAQHYQDEPQRFAAQQPHDDWPGSPAPSNAYHPQPDAYGVPPPMRPVPGFDTPAYLEPMVRPPDDYRPEHPAFNPPPSFLMAGDRQDLHQDMHQDLHHDRQQYAQQPPIYPAGPDVGAMPAPHDDEFYDDAPRGGRRKGLLTVAAVLALAVVGTTGAVGYRSYFGGPGLSGPPPVIRASGEPSKVAPPAASAATSSDPSANKFNFDRFADRSKDEQVIKREEKPIDPKDLARPNLPRTVLDSAPAASSRTATAGNPPSTIGDPKRVRTVPIRPDQGDMAVNTPSTTPENLLPAPPARQTNGFPSPPASRSAESRPESAAPQARSAPPRTVTASRAQPAPSANAPLSLAAPDAGGDTSAPPPAAARDIAPPPSRQASVAPVPRASNGGGGRFHVQVASQKSESDAEASYRSIQSKYSGVLGGQPHSVRRADLGTKGVYYRAMVGPFASREQAVQLCSSLKSAGGDCVVQAN
jgi:hypothetical protein